MKNACIVLKNNKSVFSEQDYIVATERFCAGGYALSETRILFDADEKTLLSVLNELKDKFDNVLFLTDFKQFIGVKSLVLSVFNNEVSTGISDGGVFCAKEKTLFLTCLSADLDSSSFFEKICFPYLSQKYGKKYGKFVLRAVGANENHLPQLIARVDSLSQGMIFCKRKRKFDEDVVEIFYDELAPKMLLDDILRIFAEGLEDTVYALEDCSLENQLVRLLKLRGRKISVAESFTGGGIARRITSVSGASEVYFEGLNTYNEQSKMKRLGVRAYTLNTVGAVSDQTAYEMAAGLIATGDCDISIATTGLAGPNTDKSGLPIGLCFIAIGTKETVLVYRYKFDGTREEITQKAINYALFLAYKHLKND